MPTHIVRVTKMRSTFRIGGCLLLAALVLECVAAPAAKDLTPTAVIKPAELSDESHEWALDHESEQPQGFGKKGWHKMSAKQTFCAVAVLLAAGGLIFFGKIDEGPSNGRSPALASNSPPELPLGEESMI